ncbi:hypothetical protein ACFLSF_03235 [Candidatus Bipolaricaulota bacterium]
MSDSPARILPDGLGGRRRGVGLVGGRENVGIEIGNPFPIEWIVATTATTLTFGATACLYMLLRRQSVRKRYEDTIQRTDALLKELTERRAALRVVLLDRMQLFD